jgi:pimeloyl-ACP methyl ester carboxylesterase
LQRYWDLSYNNYNYSYVDAAIARNYSTLNYDRLGIGKSSHGHPLEEIQITAEVAALAQLTETLRNGTFPGVNQTINKIVHVGHSFGSGQSYLLAHMYPNLTDAIVLTGFSTNPSYAANFLAGGAFVQANTYGLTRFNRRHHNESTPFGNLPDGYVISGTPGANAYQFSLVSHVDPGLLDYAEKTKQPATVGELLTAGSLPFVNAFTGPVLVLTGNNDVAFCGGDCLATGNASISSIPATVGNSFPGVDPSNFTAYIQPNTAHGINIHYNSTGAYAVINDFLAQKGLVSS